MHVPIFQVDAFTDGRFTGNPAAVVVLGSFPADAVLQAVAAQNNLAETAFLVRDGDGFAGSRPSLRSRCVVMQPLRAPRW
jgi:PhzF family phenazine biosynthesis protein